MESPDTTEEYLIPFFVVAKQGYEPHHFVRYERSIDEVKQYITNQLCTNNHRIEISYTLDLTHNNLFLKGVQYRFYGDGYSLDNVKYSTDYNIVVVFTKLGKEILGDRGIKVHCVCFPANFIEAEDSDQAMSDMRDAAVIAVAQHVVTPGCYHVQFNPVIVPAICIEDDLPSIRGEWGDGLIVITQKQEQVSLL